ncbi:MAG: cytochrome P450 [Xenococcaceae cyanobacterium MO_234.B1]|nr:cytochrome P450 [Xenococcaceae cyanobacterium MO_234.B1]
MVTKLPKGPNSPPWWQLIRWLAAPLSYQKECVQSYGNIFTLTMTGFPPFVVIGHPEGVKEIFSQEPDKFDEGRSNYILRPLVGDNSLLLYDGTRHQQERKLLMPPFHGQNLHSYGKSIVEIATQVAAQWQEGQRIIARKVMQQITLEVIIKVIFGINEGERYQKIKPLLAQMLDVTDSPLRSSFLFLKFLQQDWGTWSPWGRIKAQKKQIDRLLQDEIEARLSLSNQLGNDILSLMMSAKDEEGQPMTDAELKDELMTLLFAGHETTATMLAWAFYEILRHPPVLEKLREELDSSRNLAPLEIAKLPYLNAVCQEVLRFYPVAPIIFPRIAKTSIEIMGHYFEPETWLTPSAYLIHHREELYPEPEKFKPERFLERQYTPYEFFPFGGANRRCLGAALAQLEIKLVLALIISKYELTLANKKPIKPQRRGITIAPARGVPLIFQQKRGNFAKQLQNIT